MSPAARSMAHLREQGWGLVWFAEHYNCFTQRRQDLFGFLDIICLKRDEVLGVQATTSDHVAERIRKINDHDNVGFVREAGIRIEVHGWRKVKNRWQVRIVDIS